mmetsp:Transcript_25435/g.101371  ORF Transcript_25435/g.101371 Transcript_25435/m.101371 type:complete len:205 (+) Transcript_25435:1216-1830(+)
MCLPRAPPLLVRFQSRGDLPRSSTRHPASPSHSTPSVPSVVSSTHDNEPGPSDSSRVRLGDADLAMSRSTHTQNTDRSERDHHHHLGGFLRPSLRSEERSSAFFSTFFFAGAGPDAALPPASDAAAAFFARFSAIALASRSFRCCGVSPSSFFAAAPLPARACARARSISRWLPRVIARDEAVAAGSVIGWSRSGALQRPRRHP